MADTARKPLKRNSAVPVMTEEEMGDRIRVTAVDSGSKALQFLALHEDEPAGFSYDGDAPIDFPFDTATDLTEKERKLRAKEAELKRREQEVKRKEEVAARAGIVLDEKNWPPFFPIIHHDIANEIPIYLRRLRY